MKSFKDSMLIVSSKLRPLQLKREKTVHELLSDHQAAYAVFLPKPDDVFNLFEIIFLHPNRPESPSNSNTNLQDIIKDLQHEAETDYHKDLVESFLQQFEKIRHRDILRPPVVSTVSEDSLHAAGLALSTPGPSLGSKASKSRTIYRQLRLSSLTSDDYTGQNELQQLIWEHAETLFPLALQRLAGTHVSTARGDKSIMGIVTKRLISNVGVSRADEKSAMSGGGPIRLGGRKKKEYQEVYDDLYGVSGLHFIAFPVECLDRNRWRFYRGFDVCDSELDEDASPDLLRLDDFCQASHWLRGTGSLNQAAASDYKTVTDEEST